MNIKEFMNFGKKNKVSLIFGIAGAVLATATLILYLSTGVTNFTAPKPDAMMIAMLIACLVISVVTVVFDFKLAKYAAFICTLVSFVRYIVFEIDYISNIFVSIDPTEITVPFVMTLLLSVVLVALTLVAAITCPDRLETMKEEEAE